jgi:ATP-dependent RNA helicase DDX51/DBP6
MDQAMIEAEVVHPSRTVTLSSDSAEDISKLSGKTRQRLAQLGITELFAGQYIYPAGLLTSSIDTFDECTVQVALLPFLLPSTISSRSLYLPYTPLRDVCVSAPTGSGKTLAYVLPIVEVSLPFPQFHHPHFQCILNI